MAAAATFTNLHRFPAQACFWPSHPAAVLSTCSCLPFHRSHLFPRHGLIPLNLWEWRAKRTRNGSRGVGVKNSWRAIYRIPDPFRCPVGIELRRPGRRQCTPRATAVGDYGLSSRLVEVVIWCKGVLTDFVRIFEFRRQWIGVVAVVGVMTLAGIWAQRHLAGFTAGLSLGLAIWLFGRVDPIGKLPPIDVKATDAVVTFIAGISEAAHELQTIFLSVVSSRSPGKATAKNVSKVYPRIDIVVSSQGSTDVSSAESKDAAVYCESDVEMTLLNITERLVHLRSITTSEVATADIQALNGVMSRIEGLRRELQSVEDALIVKESSLHQSELGVAKVGQAACCGTSEGLEISSGDSDGVEGFTTFELVEYGGSVAVGGCREDRIRPADDLQIESEPFSVRLSFPSDGASEAQSLYSNSTLVHLETQAETSAPLLSIISAGASYGGDKAPATDGIDLVGEHSLSHNPQGESSAASILTSDKSLNESLTRNAELPVNRPINESGIGAESSSFTGDHPVGARPVALVNCSDVEERNPLSSQFSSHNDNQISNVQSTGSSWPDPWRDDPFEQKVLAGDCWEVTLNEKKRIENSQLLDISLIEGQTSNPLLKDGIRNGRGMNAYGSVDFWGVCTGRSLPKTEQRGTSTKRKAIGRGSFGSLDDLEDDLPQARERRSEEEQRQLLPRDLPSEIGHEWDGHQRGVSDWKGARDNRRQWSEGNVEANTPAQNMQRDRQFDTRKEGNFEEDSLVYTGSLGSRLSGQEQTIPNNMRPRSREMEGSPIRPIDGASSGKESKDGNKVSGSRSNRTWNMPYDSDETLERKPEVRQQAGKTLEPSLASSQLELNDRNLALEKSKQAQIQKFERYLDEGVALLEQVTQGLDGKLEVGVAERMLYDAAQLFQRASELDPADLTAVGLWGNTLLVHGELKLLLSQQLRSMLPSPNMSSPSPGPMRDNERESLELTLQEVCEECEELLVDAGRKYRRALSLDRDDVRALYNWGLALCYRGQLIVDEDGERAMQDADKVYLAAIDKFEAVLRMSESFATRALLNWGLALRDRSRLRVMGDKERVELLQQAKELFKEAVRLDPNYRTARGAVAACASEIAELQKFGARSNQIRTRETTKPNWWQRGF